MSHNLDMNSYLQTLERNSGARFSRSCFTYFMKHAFSKGDQKEILEQMNHEYPDEEPFVAFHNVVQFFPVHLSTCYHKGGLDLWMLFKKPSKTELWKTYEELSPNFSNTGIIFNSKNEGKWILHDDIEPALSDKSLRCLFIGGKFGVIVELLKSFCERAKQGA